MSPRRAVPPTRRAPGGVTVETVVLTAAVAAAIGWGLGDGGALADLLQALRDAYRRFAWAISLP